MNAKTLILAGSGTGKTTAASLCKNVVDLSVSRYAFICDKSFFGELSSQKKQNVVNSWMKNPNSYPKNSILLNPDFPNNFLTAIDSELKESIVLIPFIEEVFDIINSADILDCTRIVLVFPEIDNFDEYAERYKKRGNDENFIEIRKNEYNSLVELFENAVGYEKIVLGKGKFLADVLIENGICEPQN